MLTLFFYCSHAHRDLHSFPTRRSSDLDRSPLGALQERHLLPGPHRRDSGQVERSRSEEHTSELQSLRHLVCRLLLEKKNTNKNHTRYKKSKQQQRKTELPTKPS